MALGYQYTFNVPVAAAVIDTKHGPGSGGGGGRGGGGGNGGGNPGGGGGNPGGGNGNPGGGPKGTDYRLYGGPMRKRVRHR